MLQWVSGKWSDKKRAFRWIIHKLSWPIEDFGGSCTGQCYEMGILLSHLELLTPSGNECWNLTLIQKAFYQPAFLRATAFQNRSFLLINSCLRFLFSLVLSDTAFLTALLNEYHVQSRRLTVITCDICIYRTTDV